MRFAEWIIREKLTFQAAAKLIGVANGTAARRYTVGAIPGREVMTRIYLATRGEVTPNDFYGIPQNDEPRRIRPRLARMR
jgi:hypothetical protein